MTIRGMYPVPVGWSTPALRPPPPPRYRMVTVRGKALVQDRATGRLYVPPRPRTPAAPPRVTSLNRSPAPVPRSPGNRLEDQLVRAGTTAAIDVIPVVGPFLAPIAGPLLAPVVETVVDAVGSFFGGIFGAPGYTQAELDRNHALVMAGMAPQPKDPGPGRRTVEF